MSGIIWETETPVSDLPAADVLQIDFFGPAFGESAVIHLGDGRWMVIDSCSREGLCTPLEHLKSLGVEPERIDLIVATHWHDDHVRGIADLYAWAEKATFVLSAAVKPDEFLAVTRQRHLISRFTSGGDELSRVAEIEHTRTIEGTGPSLSPAQSSIRLLHRPNKPVSEVWTLSPSNADLAASRLHLAEALITDTQVASRVPAQQPNDTSVVIQLQTAGGSVVLGADLEHRVSSADRGWHAVLQNPATPAGSVSLFKVPHHGSKNAHCDQFWNDRVAQDALCVVTPFERGSVSLPSSEDRGRLGRTGRKVVLTSDKNAPGLTRPTVVAKTIRESTRRFKPVQMVVGHVQVRLQENAWHVRMSDASARLAAKTGPAS